MSRIRTVKPEFWTSEQIVECSPTARLLFIGFWNFADDNGVLPASAKQIKMLIYPGDDFTAADIQGFVDELLQQGLLAEFIGEDGRNYWFVTGWKKHQKIDKPSNKYPEPPLEAEHSANIRRTLGEESANARGGVGEESVTERKGEEGSGKEWKGRGVEREGSGKDGSAPSAADAASPPAPAKVPSIALSDDFTWEHITPRQREVWQTAYPSVNLDHELSKAAAWVMANPKHRKSNWARFIDGWLKRTQDQARPSASSPVNRPMTKHERLVESSRQAVETWLASKNVDVIEGECHEVH